MWTPKYVSSIVMMYVTTDTLRYRRPTDSTMHTSPRHSAHVTVSTRNSLYRRRTRPRATCCRTIKAVGYRQSSVEWWISSKNATRLLVANECVTSCLGMADKNPALIYTAHTLARTSSLSLSNCKLGNRNASTRRAVEKQNQHHRPPGRHHRTTVAAAADQWALCFKSLHGISRRPRS